MSQATLALLQSALAEIYDLPAMPDVRDYLMTNRAHLAGFGEARHCDEQLFVAEEGDTLSMALYIDAAVLERLASHDPFEDLTHENLADYLTAAEGVSHFVYVAWNTGHDKPVTLLELELQAEVDKYVLGHGCCASRATAAFRASCTACCSNVRLWIRSRPPDASACTTWLRIMPRGSVGAWQRCLSAGDSASPVTSWRSCADFIAGGTCANYDTSSATL